MSYQGYKVLDSDIHVMEPANLWQEYIEPEFRAMAPVGSEEFIGDIRMTGPDGSYWGRAPVTVQKRGIRRNGRNHQRVQEVFKPYDDRGWTSEVELEAMDREGIDLGVLFPSRGLYALSAPDIDPPLAAAIARAYNNWLYDFCKADPSRLLGAAMISPFDVNDAIEETRRCINELGFKGVFLRPNEVNDRNWHDPYYDPLWSTLEELDAALGFHEGSGSALRQVGDQFKSNGMLRHVMCHPGEQMLAVVSMLGGGVLARHPKLRVAFLEGNCSWLPFLLWRLDEHWERENDVYGTELEKAPSEYFRDQGYASVEPDEVPAKYAIDYMGNSNFLFSTDFPHGDAKFPDAVKTFMELPLSDEDRRKILWDNCARFYAIDS